MNAWLRPVQATQGTRSIQAFVGGTGGPTVVFEAGLGCHSAYWGDLPARTSALTSVVAYDRAGLGASEPRSEAPSPAAFAADLAAVLEAAGAAPPYVLVGHSFGGFLIRGFAARHPDLVGALLFVDSSTENEMDGLSERVKRRDRWASVALKVNVFVTRLGIGRLGIVRKQVRKTYPGFPPEILDSIITRIGTPRHWQTNLEELKAYAAVADDVRQSRGHDILGVPITVITGVGYPDEAIKLFEMARGEFREFHVRRQRDALVSLSPGARHVVAERSGHFVQHDEPDLLFSEIEALVHRIHTAEGRAE